MDVEHQNSHTSRCVFVFLDGFGIGRENAYNPIYTQKIFNSFGVQPTHGVDISSSKLVVKGIDACLNVTGIPQSATGQTALFTGINAAELLGYHLPAYPNTLLQELIKNNNMFIEAKKAGVRATFANAYRPEYFDMVKSGRLQHSVTTVACLAAGVPLRIVNSRKQYDAVFWDITGEHSHTLSGSFHKKQSPEDAGASICSLSDRYDLVLFESFLPDMIGHSRNMNHACEFCEILSRFINAIVNNIGRNATVIITSDHGNFEDFETGSHTRNPALLFAYGPDAGYFSNATSITDMPSIVISLLRQ